MVRNMFSLNFCDISIAVSGPKVLYVPVITATPENLTFRVESEVEKLALELREA